ncbi:hypothetical protein [Nocardioides sp. InS609-2]|uniref:hypothetical protein n=1 Tax=Nocardioides sp. InS609-2 TaxID=2760705 RepID=UPI0020C00185|nr:hypothetical protein [Nocardioides sp. InS609-2]
MPRSQPPDFVDSHAAGLWNAGPADWRGLVTAVLDAEIDGVPVSLLGMTETTQLTPWVPPGWGLFHDGPARDTGRDECTIAWDESVWESAGPGWAEPLTGKMFRLEDGRVRPRVHAVGKPLRHRVTGHGIVRVELHAPSGTDGGTGLRRNERAAVTRDILAGRRQLKKALRKQYPGFQILESADENVDLRRQWVRQLLDRAGGIGIWVKRRLPGRGTHGPRLIDGSRHSRRLRLVLARVLARVRPFDHRPLVAGYRFLGKKRRR